MPKSTPKDYLSKIAESSPILAKVLRQALGGRPLRAKRFLGCCGKNTDQLVEGLEDAIGHVRLDCGEQALVDFPEKRFSSTVKMAGDVVGGYTRKDHYSPDYGKIQAIKLLKKIKGLKVPQLFLDPGQTYEGTKRERKERVEEGCQRVLLYWIRAEVLQRQSAKLSGDIKNYNEKFIQLFSEEITTLEDFSKNIAAMRRLKIEAEILAGRIEILRGGIPNLRSAIESSSLAAGAAVGKEQALAVLNETSEMVEGFSLHPLPVFLGPEGINLDIVSVNYLADFNYGYRAGAIGKEMLEGMRARVTDLIKSLREASQQRWSEYVEFIGKLSFESMPRLLSQEEITAHTDRLIAELNVQVALFDKLITPHGATFKIGFARESMRTLSTLIPEVTSFLRANVPEEPVVVAVPAVNPAEIKVVVAPPDPKPEEESGAKAVGVDGGASLPRSDIPPAAVAATSYVRMFKAPSSSLTEEQKDRIDKLVKFIPKTSEKGRSFAEEQLAAVVMTLTRLVSNASSNVNMALFLIAEKLSVVDDRVNVKWLRERKIDERVERLFKSAVDAPAP